MTELIVFIFGLLIGSFLNVLIYRLPRGLSFAKGRSFCPECKKKISWYDNIPLLSFLILKGKCRNCKEKISWRYPAIELLTGTIFLVSYLSHLSFLGYLLFSSLIVIFFIDLKHFIIPLEIIYPLIILFLIFRIIDGNFLNYFFSGLGAFLFLLILFLITRGKGMGFGDVQFAFLMGLALGFPKIIAAFYLAFLTGAIIGLILIIRGKAKFKKPIPFGPFLSGSVFISYLWGEKIVNFVLAKFF